MTCPPPRSALMASILPGSICALAGAMNATASSANHKVKRIGASSKSPRPNPRKRLNPTRDVRERRSMRAIAAPRANGMQMRNLSAADVIRLLDLKPHPEGGHFRETFRDSPAVENGRVASTAIYFLLARDERSHWHR